LRLKILRRASNILAEQALAPQYFAKDDQRISSSAAVRGKRIHGVAEVHCSEYFEGKPLRLKIL